MKGGLASAAAFDAEDPDELPFLEPDPVLPPDEPEELEEPVLELVDEPVVPVLELVDDPPVLLLVVVLERVPGEPDDVVGFLLSVVSLTSDFNEMVTDTLFAESS